MAVRVTVELSDEVRDARRSGRPVVALETSVLAQGLAPPNDEEAATRMAAAIRAAGAEPAWVWVDRGAVRAGARDAELERLMRGDATKVARRDLPMAVASGGLGATTVSATLWAARASGLGIAATGGIGGVHFGSRDVSADLTELATAGGALVCSGPKSIIDPSATLERLEELGVGLVGFRCDTLPHFLVRDSALPLEHRADTPEGVAAVISAARGLGTPSTVLVCNPIPEDDAMPPATVEDGVAACQALASEEGVTGKELTPFLLGCLAERTEGASVRANLALLEANAALAGAIAVALAPVT